MKVCPKCGKVVDFNSYFGAYICDECGWEDNSYSRERISYFSQRRDSYEETKEKQSEYYIMK